MERGGYGAWNGNFQESQHAFYRIPYPSTFGNDYIAKRKGVPCKTSLGIGVCVCVCVCVCVSGKECPDRFLGLCITGTLHHRRLVDEDLDVFCASSPACRLETCGGDSCLAARHVLHSRVTLVTRSVSGRRILIGM
ncbi:hypothetical protein K504DRAFT_192456 [Pleomassaria siparia CBS 279.74]|uniref:Uncharacterized protein n=1 Tax=Pleomassaria siparia CBS 279.74 TaxID=1314801 RepID=A0A6G1KHA6_9PLEO|nr:hypothetical protein K504DRAFT_192456 [Pleomassaria siparia CBS 279.74]